jgi:hypothetical protein
MITNFNLFLFESNVKKNERIEILRDDNYIVVAPLTERASCKYGAFTHWCISAPGSGYFENYNNINLEGKDKLIFILNRKLNITQKQKDVYDKYNYIFYKYENSDFYDGENEETVLDKKLELEETDDFLDFSKICIYYNYKQRTYGIYSGNNIFLNDFGYDIHNLDAIGIEPYVIDAIFEFCKK